MINQYGNITNKFTKKLIKTAIIKSVGLEGGPNAPETDFKKIPYTKG